MLAYFLALAIALGSLAIYLAAFLFPAAHRKSDFIWSGVGLFYALVLWVCAGRITGGVLLGQAASVALLGWFGWQTLTLRAALAPSHQQTQVPGASPEILQAGAKQITEKLTTLTAPGGRAQLQNQFTRIFTTLKDKAQAVTGKGTERKPTALVLSSEVPTPEATSPRVVEVELPLEEFLPEKSGEALLTPEVPAAEPSAQSLEPELTEPESTESELAKSELTELEPAASLSPFEEIPAAPARSVSPRSAKPKPQPPGILASLKEMFTSMTRRKSKPTIILDHTPTPVLEAPQAVPEIDEFDEQELSPEGETVVKTTVEMLEVVVTDAGIVVTEQLTVVTEETAFMPADEVEATAEELAEEAELELLNNETVPPPEVESELVEPESFTNEGEVAAVELTEEAATISTETVDEAGVPFSPHSPDTELAESPISDPENQISEAEASTPEPGSAPLAEHQD